jgi:hypothetical protein
LEVAARHGVVELVPLPAVAPGEREVQCALARHHDRDRERGERRGQSRASYRLRAVRKGLLHRLPLVPLGRQQATADRHDRGATRRPPAVASSSGCRPADRRGGAAR